MLFLNFRVIPAPRPSEALSAKIKYTKGTTGPSFACPDNSNVMDCLVQFTSAFMADGHLTVRHYVSYAIQAIHNIVRMFLVESTSSLLSISTNTTRASKTSTQSSISSCATLTNSNQCTTCATGVSGCICDADSTDCTCCGNTLGVSTKCSGSPECTCVKSCRQSSTPNFYSLRYDGKITSYMLR